MDLYYLSAEQTEHNMKPNICRIRIELSPADHHAVRLAAANYDMSMTMFAEDAVVAAAMEVNKPRRVPGDRPSLPLSKPVSPGPDAMKIFGDCPELQPLRKPK